MMSEANQGADTAREAARPLEGVRVISLAQQFPGPFASMILADLGADVIIVENPRAGDPTRRFPAYFEALNRNQRAIALDLKTPEGKQALLALADTSDVLLEGFRPGVAARLGISAEDLRARNPALVYVSISSFGQTGPLGAQGGHDITVQARAGLLNGRDDIGHPSLPLADVASAMFAVVGVLAALVGRAGSTRGTHVDVSMLDSLLALQSAALVPALNGREPAPYPPLDPGYGVFEIGSDGELIALGIAGEDAQWDTLCRLLGVDELVGIDAVARESRRDELREALSSALQACGRDIIDRLMAAGVGVSPVNRLQTVAADPQVKARGLICPLEDDPATLVIRQPLLFDGTAASIRRRAPALGEHTDEVLREVIGE